MSTISRALLKNKFEKTGSVQPIQEYQSTTNYWKLAFAIALLVIIGLLSVLLYLQFYPVKKAEHPHQNEEIVQSHVTPPTAENTLVKMTFDTQPIPEPIPEPIVPKQAKSSLVKQQTTPKALTANTEKTINNEEKQNKAIAAKPSQDSQIQQTGQQNVNNDDFSSELKKRFDLAVLLTEMEQNEATEEENLANTLNDNFAESYPEAVNDGSDIHLMSSNFQNKVPLMLYDSHVYSSLASERWIRINGETLVEGGVDSTGKIELIEIQPQRSIFRVDRQSFSLESLTDWKGY